jgi:hypothetical protein
MIKTDIYLDVDGVLFTINPKTQRFELRNGLIEFLQFLTDNFENCYWLTCWYDGFNNVLKQIYAGDIAEKFKTCKWNDNKALSIDFSRDFIWIEDGILEEERRILIDHGCYDKYIFVPEYGDLNRLYRIKKELQKRFNI